MATIIRPTQKTVFYPRDSAYLITTKSIPSVPYTCRPGNKDKTSLVVLPNFQDAFEVSRILESHYMSTREWPDISRDDLRIKLIDRIPTLLRIESIDPTSVLQFCIDRNLHVCIIERIMYSEESIRLSCELMEVNVPELEYIDSFEKMFKIDL